MKGAEYEYERLANSMFVLGIVSSGSAMDDIVVVGKHAIRIFDDFQFSLFDFPHLSSFNACEELDHLIILYSPPQLSPALMSIGGSTVPQLLWWRRPCILLSSRGKPLVSDVTIPRTLIQPSTYAHILSGSSIKA